MALTMAEDCLLNTWLDRWEDLQAEGDPVTLDRFVADYCAGASPRDVEEFKAKVRALQVIDAELMPGMIPTGGAGSSQTGLSTESLDLRPGCEPLPGFHLLARLGKGGFGQVWRALAPGGWPVALKFVEVENGRGEQEQNSLMLLQEFQHPSLTNTFGTWYGEKWLVIAMELADGTLHDRLVAVRQAGERGIPFAELLTYMAAVAEGLDFLNKPRHPDGQRLHHGDVKPHNLLLVGGRAKLADFGLVRVTKRSVTEYAGARTEPYAAPEFYKKQSSGASDQYSLAITYSELRGGRLPFEGKNSAEWAGCHLYQAPDLSMIPEDERPAVARALAKDPRDRWPSCAEFVRAIEQRLGDAVTVINSVATTAADKRLQIERWAEYFVAQTATKLTEAWPALADDLRKNVGELTVYQLSRGPGDDFREKVIAPAVEAWHQRYVQPLLDEASGELRIIAQADLDRLARDPIATPSGGTVQALDVVRAMTVPAGVLVGGGAVAAGIVTTTKLLVLTTAAVHWPVLVTGLVVGAVISWFGIADLMWLRQRLQTRFENNLLPVIEEALIGAGVDHEGEHIPSLREQLEQQVRETADRLSSA